MFSINFPIPIPIVFLKKVNCGNSGHSKIGINNNLMHICIETRIFGKIAFL